MFKLSSANDPEPFWLDLMPGVRVQLRPSEPTPMLLAARRAGQAVRAVGGNLADAEFAFTSACATWGALAWEGVGTDTGGDDALPFTSEGLVELLRQSPSAYAAIDADYVTPALLVEAEKNGSSPSLNGTSGAAKATAAPAKASAPSALTGKTTRAQKKASASGR